MSSADKREGGSSNAGVRTSWKKNFGFYTGIASTFEWLDC